MRTNLAFALANYAHHGQLDKAGEPYIYHVYRVYALVENKAANGMDYRTDRGIVALLHDVLEDTNVTYSTIHNLFGERVADAVVALTREIGEDYLSYITRVSENPLATEVKIADLTHNMDLTRLPRVGRRDLKRQERYRKAKEILEESRHHDR